ncbi:alpha- and gamma-adaptin-binding protein p34 isoform X3 [Petaurus breviceps papuanus]|uniref:alpha- and gamma-adaptin-binding protein p34 isoform X3 n=1 Tax=Petaurus breviceps papuanus TaxID=3040969 RepID=UPI0036DBE310
MAAGVPCALVTSCSSTFTGDRLVQHILGTEDLAADTPANNGVRFYPWTIDNKYYSADINLCVVPNRFLVTAEIAEAVQAFIVYFDSTQKSGLDSVSSWLPLAEAWLPEVMILVCDRVSDNGVNRPKAQEWCIQHGFELVELSPEELPEEDERNQSFGLLSSLAGANCNIGSTENHHTEPHLPVGNGTECCFDHQDSASNTTDSQVDSIVDPMLDLDIQELASLTTGGGNLENFERLFSKLKEMKDKAATLPHEQRKLHAEKVAKAFWMAIGGDRDEIEGISSDEEN